MELVYVGDEPGVIGAQSVGQYLDDWLRDAVAPSVAVSTHDKRWWAGNEHTRLALGGDPGSLRVWTSMQIKHTVAATPSRTLLEDLFGCSRGALLRVGEHVRICV